MKLRKNSSLQSFSHIDRTKSRIDFGSADLRSALLFLPLRLMPTGRSALPPCYLLSRPFTSLALFEVLSQKIDKRTPMEISAHPKPNAPQAEIQTGSTPTKSENRQAGRTEPIKRLSYNNEKSRALSMRHPGCINNTIEININIQPASVKNNLFPQRNFSIEKS